VKKVHMYAAAVGVAAGALTMSACTSSTPAPAPSPSVATNVVVPDVVGVALDLASKQITEAGLVLGNVSLSAEGKVPGAVIGQSVSSGLGVPPGTIIDVVVTADVSTVPVLLSLTTVEAERAIVAAGFIVGTVKSVNSSSPAGEVVAQSPAAGEKISQGSVVDLRVANGTEGLVDVVGLTQKSAEAALAAENLKVKVKERFSSDAKGTVVSQSPTAGTKVKVGSTVVLVVSRGPEPAPTPTPTPTSTPTSTPATTPATTPVKLKCDDMQITAAVEEALNKEGVALTQVNQVRCVDTPKGDPAWAAAAVITGTEPDCDSQNLIFQVKDGKWVYERQDKVCGLESAIPNQIRNFGC